MSAASASIRRRRMHKYPGASSENKTAQKSDSGSTIVDLRRRPHNRQQKRRFSLRDQFIRTNVDIYILVAFFAIINGLKLHLQVVEATELTEQQLNKTMVLLKNCDSRVNDLLESLDWDGEDAQVFAVFFPIFCQSMAIFIYYALSRYLTFIPYTAVVFLVGVGIGYNAEYYQQQNAILVSSLNWISMNGEVILLIFLPGLIFLDAVTINVHLFFQAFWQLIIFAFPMVLVGAVLTAVVAKYTLPYGWGWNLCMTFGSILSATDPVAVAGLFHALGAPPRMEMHISGESLLNDGSSVLLYSIFSQRFFYEMNVKGFGEEIGWAKGFEMFFRLTFGGGLIGLCFGLSTVAILKLLDRRLSAEENVVQVVLTITVAYMAYFVAEVMSGCSGIISTIVCGLTVKVLGITLVHDASVMLNFWRVLAEILNTLLFVLGGTLWGNIISPSAGSFNFVSATPGPNDRFFGRDWGYLIALYLMLIIIRFILVFGAYPLISRIGIGQNWKEATFMAFGGFRGTVGIALALSLSSQLSPHACSRRDHECGYYRKQANELFCFVGGVSILTLTVNGLLSGPLLKLLKLSKSEKTRKKVVENYWKNMVEHVLVEYVRLLSQDRFQEVDFSLVREHVPFIGGIKFAELMAAVEVHKRLTPPYLYSAPNLAHVIPYILQTMRHRRKQSVFVQNGYSLETFGTNNLDIQAQTTGVTSAETRVAEQSVQSTEGGSKNSGQTAQQRRQSQAMCFMKCDKDIFDPKDAHESNEIIIDEERLNFIEILRRSYHDQLSNGELDESGDLQYSLFEGLTFSEEAASKGQPLNDWNATKVASATNVVFSNRVFNIVLIQLKLKLSHLKKACKEILTCKKKCCSGVCDKNTSKQSLSSNYELYAISKVSFSVRQSLAFRHAHLNAQKVFVEEFATCPLSPAEEKVIEESKAQVRLAEQDLGGIDTDDVIMIKGHLICWFLLNKAVKYVETLSWQGLIPEKDANEMLALLVGYREQIILCRTLHHKGMLDLKTQLETLRRLPQHRIEELNLASMIQTMARKAVPEDVETAQEDDTIEGEYDLDDTHEPPEENSLFSSMRSRVSV